VAVRVPQSGHRPRHEARNSRYPKSQDLETSHSGRRASPLKFEKIILVARLLPNECLGSYPGAQKNCRSPQIIYFYGLENLQMPIGQLKTNN
jgi:hypothetical protein